MQNLLKHFKDQGATGVRFQFALCGGFFSTPLSCPNGQPANPNWIQGVNSFLDDVVAAKLTAVSPSIAHMSYEQDAVLGPCSYSAWSAANPFPAPDPNPDGSPSPCPAIAAPANSGSSSPSSNACTEIPTSKILFFWSASPFPVSGTHLLNADKTFLRYDNGQYAYDATSPYGRGDNNALNCVPVNPSFVGWANINATIDGLLGAIASHSLTLTEFDVEQELDLLQFPVQARFIYDATAANANDSGTGDCRTEDSYCNIQKMVHARWPASPAVTYSVTAFRPYVTGKSCGSVYASGASDTGHSARLLRLDEILSAIGGGRFGFPDTGTGYDPSSGLPCDGQFPNTAAVLPIDRRNSMLPGTLDVHSYPCILDASTNGCQPSTAMSDLASEALEFYTDLWSFMKTPKMTVDIHSAAVIIGETNSNSYSGSWTCEGTPLGSSFANATGFSNSFASRAVAAQGGTAASPVSVIIRPWLALSDGCYTGAMNILPPYGIQ